LRVSEFERKKAELTRDYEGIDAQLMRLREFEEDGVEGFDDGEDGFGKGDDGVVEGDDGGKK
jgi:hypothetical protein